MKVLLTGATGYIGRRLLPKLIEEGHEVVCFARSPERLGLKPELQEKVTVLKGDFLSPETLQFPEDIDAAYYLVHSMATGKSKFQERDLASAQNFITALEKTRAKQVIYLGGIANDENLSEHLSSRRKVEEMLKTGKVPVTTLRSGIVVGSGSAGFEILRDLTEKLPVMITPNWIRQSCQPIAIYDVVDYLIQVLKNKACLGKTFEICGPDIMSYRDAILRYAKFRGLRRVIFILPLLTLYLSALWLYFVTSVSFPLARSLIEGVRNNAIKRDFSIDTIIPKQCLGYEEALQRAFAKIQESTVIPTWDDRFIFSSSSPEIGHYILSPQYGCFKGLQQASIKDSSQATLERIWSIGSEKGWYGLNYLWCVRGQIDKILGGVGARRGRRDPKDLRCGDTIDFWRVILADQEHSRLLLYAEMKLPGEAWLEWRIEGNELFQEATFRPKGVWGRCYWAMMYPFHLIIFRKMAKRLAGN